jgi:hypothetical protein
VRFAASNRVLNRAQRVAVVAALGASMLAVSGCTYTNPQATTEISTVADGVNASLGRLDLRNLLVISAGKDKEGRLIGAVANGSDQEIQLTITGAAGSRIQFSIPSHGSYTLDKSTEAAVLSKVSEMPGSLEPLKFSQNGQTGPQSADLSVPVFDGTLPEYAAYVPGGATASSSSTSTSTSTSSRTSADTASEAATSGATSGATSSGLASPQSGDEASSLATSSSR